MDLLLVDEDGEAAAALAAALRDLGHAVAVAHSGRDALRSLHAEPHDAVILDRTLPQSDGRSVLAQLRREEMTLPVILLGASGRIADKVEALDAGADDYLVRPVAAEELAARLNALLRGRRWGAGSRDTIRAGDIVVSPGKFRAWRAGRDLALGTTELNLLAELARNAGEVLTRPVLLERVWGDRSGRAATIVDTYVCRLRARLALPGRADPIVTMRGVGYMLRR